MQRVRALLLLLAFAGISCQSLQRFRTFQQLDLVSATRVNPDGTVVNLEHVSGTTAGTFIDEHVRGYVGAMENHFDIFFHFRHDTLALIHWDTATYKDDTGADYLGLLPMDEYVTGMDIIKRGDVRYFVGPDELAKVSRARGEGVVDSAFPPFLAALPAGARAEITIPAHIHGKSYKYVFAFRKAAQPRS